MCLLNLLVLASMRKWRAVFGRLLDFLNRLDRAPVSYQLRHTRPDSVMIDISLPGWRWKVEFMVDGSIDIER